mgnify:CR=1 FL=1
MILFQDDAVRQFQEAGLKTFCYNIHWFKMKPKPKWAELTKDIDLRNFGWDGDLQSGSSMIQFLIEKGAVYHKCCSDKPGRGTPLDLSLHHKIAVRLFHYFLRVGVIIM